MTVAHNRRLSTLKFPGVIVFHLLLGCVILRFMDSRSETYIPKGELHHFGKWLDWCIKGDRMTRREFAKQAGISESRLFDLIGQAAPNLRAATREKIEKVLKLRPHELEYQLELARKKFVEGEQPAAIDFAVGVGAKMVTGQLKRSRQQPVQEAAFHARRAGFPRMADGLLRRVAQQDEYGFDRVDLMPWYEMPVFDLGVAAGFWTDISGVEAVQDQRLYERGLFQTRVRGDSMEPKYPDGCLVVFRMLRFDHDDLQVGKNYYVQRADGLATFKRLLDFDSEQLTFAAINSAKYKKVLTVERVIVTAMAVAVGEFQPD